MKTFKLRCVHLMALFAFTYVGHEVTVGSECLSLSSGIGLADLLQAGSSPILSTSVAEDPTRVIYRLGSSEGSCSGASLCCGSASW